MLHFLCIDRLVALFLQIVLVFFKFLFTQLLAPLTHPWVALCERLPALSDVFGPTIVCPVKPVLDPVEWLSNEIAFLVLLAYAGEHVSGCCVQPDSWAALVAHEPGLAADLWHALAFEEVSIDWYTTFCTELVAESVLGGLFVLLVLHESIHVSLLFPRQAGDCVLLNLQA